MTDFLIYDAKVAVLIAAFYMFYRLMLSKETFHRVNRVVLLLTAAASFVLPLCVITVHKTVMMEATPMVSVGDVQAEIATEGAPEVWQVVLPLLFIIGVAATLAHTLVSLMKVLLLIRRSEKHPQPDGITLCVTGNAKVSPFSWMHYIVMNRSDYEKHDAAILAHERGHVRLRHSWDLLLVDLLTALQWFNPAMWMLRQDLRAIHEYEADGAVLSQGINARQYQYLLISKATGIGGYSIANGISHSTLKNRITMMLHKKSPRSNLLKLLALLPIVGIALALNAETVTDVVYQQPQKKIIKKGKKDATIKTGSAGEVVVVEQTPDDQKPKSVKIPNAIPDDQNPKPVEMPNAMAVDTKEKAFDVVEQMPQFPNGAAALMKFLSENVRYPEEAHKAGVQGRVIANFVVEKDGSITNAKVFKSVSPELDAEALRVICSMPNWTPGMQNGKPVRVKYTIPINFKLQGGQQGEKAAPKHIIIGPHPNAKDVEVIIDGKVVDVAELNSIKPDDIESINVEKAKDDMPKDRILITMKKK